jgi:hypothetical protein
MDDGLSVRQNNAENLTVTSGCAAGMVPSWPAAAMNNNTSRLQQQLHQISINTHNWIPQMANDNTNIPTNQNQSSSINTTTDKVLNTMVMPLQPV